MKIRDHYDWIVIGEEPAGLLAAAMAARLGLSVLVLQTGRSMPPRITHEGLVLDPESNYFPAMSPLAGRANLLRVLLQSVSDDLPVEREIRSENGITQVISKRFRLAYGGTQDLLERELSREVPDAFLERTCWFDAIKGMERHAQGFWRRFPRRFEVLLSRSGVATSGAGAGRPGGKSSSDEFVDWSRSVRKHLMQGDREIFRAFPLSSPAGFPAGTVEDLLSDQWVFEEEFQEWMGAVLNATHGPCDVTTLDLPSKIQGMGLARSGAGFRGGAHGFRRWLRLAAERLGVHLPPRRECRRIFLDQGKLIGVQMEHRGSVITCGGVLLACSTDEVRPLFTEGTTAVPVRFGRDVQPVSWQFAVALNVDRAGVPPTLPCRGWISDSSAPGIEFEQLRSFDYSGQERDEVSINLRTRVPLSLGPNAFNPGELHRIALRMHRKFSEVFPGIEKHLLGAFPDFRASDFEAACSSLYPFENSREIPAPLRHYSCHEQGMGSQSGLDTILLANREAYPEIGALGPYVAAVESVAWLAHRAGLGGPLPAPDSRSAEEAMLN